MKTFLKYLLILLFSSPDENIKVDNNIEETNITYSISVEKIDSAQFFNTQKSIRKEKKMKKITDLDTAKRLLKGIVEFREHGDYERFLTVTKINFRNGTKYENPYDFDEGIFVAYFPTEDILLCEGGHTSDMSFNLTNGMGTEETGNPDLIISSPKNQFRLNGYFEGQECYNYFIQKNNNGNFEKIIHLGEEFEKLTEKWLCTIGTSFWTDESTLYLTETDYSDNGTISEYFKIKIIENYK